MKIYHNFLASFSQKFPDAKNSRYAVLENAHVVNIVDSIWFENGVSIFAAVYYFLH